MSRFETLASKLEKKIKFNSHGWIVLNEWCKDKSTGSEYLNTLRFDDKELAVSYLMSEPGRYTVDSECKV